MLRLPFLRVVLGFVVTALAMGTVLEISRHASVVQHAFKKLPAVNFVGPVGGLSGLGESSRLYLQTLQLAGVQVRMESFGMGIYSGPSLPVISRSKINFLHLNVRSGLMPLLKRPDFLELIHNRINIGVVYWEVEFPKTHVEILRKLDEIWCPSPFMQDLVLSACPKCLTRLVRPYIKGIEYATGKERFGSQGDKFLFFFNFDPDADIDRKNPLALAMAFAEEFSEDEGALCVIKMRSTTRRHQQLTALEKISFRRKDVVLVKKNLKKRELDSLYSSIDVYVSPHRSEGLGLTIIEAMLRGKPVIATAYGGVADLTTVERAFPVKFDMVSVGENASYNPSSTWAEIRKDALKKAMRFVFSEREKALRIAREGQQFVEKTFSLTRTTRALAEALIEVKSKTPSSLRP
jgi:glycosyltransferase involved in cell wall biosynthesis